MIWYEIIKPILDDSKQQNNSWKVNSPSASNEIPRILWNPKVHYHFHNISSLVLILNHMIQSTVFHHISLRYILILHFHLKSGLLSGSPTNVAYAFSFAFIRVEWMEQDQDGTAVPSWFCSQAISKSVWHMPLLCVQWQTPDDGQRNCPKHVEFHSKNKFEKLVHLVCFIIR